MNDAATHHHDSEPEEGLGIRCPKCHCRLVPYVNTLPVQETVKLGWGRSISRKRQCAVCKHVFRTRETVVNDESE